MIYRGGSRMAPFVFVVTLAIAAIVFLLVSLNWTVLARLAYAVPPFSWIAHDRLRFVFDFFAAIVAARTVSRWRNWDLVIAALTTVMILPPAIYAFHKMYGINFDAMAATGMVCLVLFWIASFAATTCSTSSGFSCR